MNAQLYSHITIDIKQNKVIVEYLGFNTFEDCQNFVEDLSDFFAFSIYEDIQNQTFHWNI